MQNLRNDMTMLMTRLAEILTTADDGRSDLHRETCIRLADEFELWENDSFPLWLCHVVGGEMRERFPERYASE